jgi:hypothetical protein
VFNLVELEGNFYVNGVSSIIGDLIGNVIAGISIIMFGGTKNSLIFNAVFMVIFSLFAYIPVTNDH